MESNYPSVALTYGFPTVTDALFSNQNLGKHVNTLWRSANGTITAASYPSLSPAPYNGWVVPPAAAAAASSSDGTEEGERPCSTTSSNGGAVSPSPVKCEPTSTTTDCTSEEVSADTSDDGDSKWVMSKQNFSWDNSPVASYNHVTKMFRCVACNTVGFSLRIAEHYLGTHANAKVFQCPHCPYNSSWSRCVRMHMGKHHGMHHVPDSLWKGQPLLDEILQLLQNLKESVEAQIKAGGEGFESIARRYSCPKCPYSTDRRDLYARHENIHRDEKPFHCYVCLKMFNRADHVKKHFYRIHKEQPYDISLIRRYPAKNGTTSVPTSTAVVSAGAMASFPWCGKSVGGGGTSSPRSSTSRVVTPPVSCSASDPQDEKPGGKKKPAKNFHCTYCPWRGVDNWCLRRHLNTHIKPFPCPLCDYKAARSERLATHVLKVHSKYACQKCTAFVTDNEALLQQHLKEKHTYSTLEKSLTCSMCSETFGARSELETHSILSHNQRLVECGLNRCDFRTADIAILEKHQQDKHHFFAGAATTTTTTESEETKPRNLCHQCGCDFADATSLSNHVEAWHRKAHSNRGYLCSICGYSCRRQPTMMVHMRSHAGRRLRCQAGDGCCYATAQPRLLADHVAKKHDFEGAARCPHCGEPGNTLSAFLTHCSQHHKHKSRLNDQSSFSTFGQQSTSAVASVSCSLCLSIQKRFFSDCSLTPVEREFDLVANTPEDDDVMVSLRVVDQKSLLVLPLNMRKQLFLVSYRRRLRKLALIERLLVCRPCYRNIGRPIYYRSAVNLMLHQHWKHSHFQCSKCLNSFRWQYQLWLHKKSCSN